MLKITNITMRFGTVPVLDGVELTLGRTDAIAIVGRSGSGKTTLLRLIAGLETPISGTIHWEGELLSGPGFAVEPHRRNIAYVFQEPRLWPHMNVRQNIEFALHKGSAVEKRARVDEVCEMTGLTGLQKRYPSEISGGEARRVSLARALVGRRRLVLMDEPLTNLDHRAAEELLACIKQLRELEPCAMCYVSHNPSEASALGIPSAWLESRRIKEMPS